MFIETHHSLLLQTVLQKLCHICTEKNYRNWYTGWTNLYWTDYVPSTTVYDYAVIPNAIQPRKHLSFWMLTVVLHYDQIGPEKEAPKSHPMMSTWFYL